MPIYRVPVKIEFAASGGPAFNVFHIRTVSSAADELHDALDALADFYTPLLGNYHDTTTLTIGQAMIKDPLGSPEYVPDRIEVLEGTGGTSTAPTLLSLVVSWRTVSATKSGRGRTFLGPFVAGLTDGNDGTPGAATLTAFRNAANGLVAASGGLNDWAVGVLSQKQGIMRDITGATVADRWSYLSSRRD